MLRAALWPSEGDRDAIIHTESTDCPLGDFSNDTFDRSIVEAWNHRAPDATARLQGLREASSQLLSEIDAGSDIDAIVDASGPLRTALAKLEQEN